ncbi:hypothetical protein SAMN04490244_103276 [Tranquillimonas rosea]|uniref:Uncharacterized protein n=1 Tax=Tranquillimonas rosea TaxID=641238 RepID=A0A1H9SNF2_9RHOB|nr:hypothetical protein [Tranquillimonas rosea]SER85903.1 hypothetical protein SAMN04490244_103276 [Tranquillimonas rosea]
MARDGVKVEQHSGLGLAWLAGWLFAIGYLDLSFWQGVIALVLWPYFLGADLAALQPAAAPAQ